MEPLLHVVPLNYDRTHYMITGMNHAVLQFYDTGIIDIDCMKKQIYVCRNYKPGVEASCSRNKFMERCGFPEMNTTKKFEKYLNVGIVRDYTILNCLK